MAPPVVLMRASLAEDDELLACREHFTVYESRCLAPADALIVGRYSVLPYYAELEADLACNGSRLVNTHAQHRYVADLRRWYPDLAGLTPRTWFSLANFKYDCASRRLAGSFVLKGETNSKKNQWNTHCFARTASDVDAVYSRLADDGYLSDQEIYIREYVPLRQFGVGVRGLPITEEYRFFVLDGKVVGSGYYWSQFPETRDEHKLSPDQVDAGFLRDVISRVGSSIRFFVVDVARKADGGWLVIELNDGQMSGLSDVCPSKLYKNMLQVLTPEA